MLILAIDTEASGLSHSTNQIIEVGAVLVDLENNKMTQISTFSQTVFLRSETLDPVVVKLTGITKQELDLAPKLHIVQESWYNWLNPLIEKQIVYIVGHSLDFDIKYLKQESWFLPPNYQEIDTLPLSKILMPEFGAVNLEFITQKLELKVTSQTNHRALYDAELCLGLLKYQIKKIEQLPLSNQMLEFLIKNYLKLPLIFYPKVAQNFYIVPIKDEIIYLDISGNPTSKTVSERVLDFTKHQELPTLFEDFDILEYKSVILKIWILLGLKQQNPAWNFKLHLEIGLETYLFEIISKL
jgi:DNA polymerase III epsilon subunit-like protein